RSPRPPWRLARGRAGGAGTPSRGGNAAAEDSEGSGGRAVTAPRLLPRRSVSELARRGSGLDAKTLAAAARIVEAVRKRGEVALRKHAERFGDVAPGAPLYYNRADLARTLAGLSPEERTRLERVAARIRAFAVAQRGALAVGGAQAIAALAYCAGSIAPRDVIIGPGNRWVAAAKRLVAGTVAIDMLAGPSELIVFADESADPATVAADLLAQAEHDPH